MATPFETYGQIRLKAVQKALVNNYFDATVHETLEEASDHVIDVILPASGARSAGFGGSATLAASNLVPRLKAISSLEVIDRNDPSLDPDQRVDFNRRTLLTDLFICSSNAVTMDGELVNIDKQGNRVAAIAYGPKKVALLVGRNKIAKDLHEALARSRNVAAGANAIRLAQDTPCAKTGKCHDCKGESRLCRTIVITQRS
ncbi:MAG: lactate utilization protein, partial [Deltaproteobacteria bacterium]|nr:lactate utilization protein [Deltaproteobacteria bacterium]